MEVLADGVDADDAAQRLRGGARRSRAAPAARQPPGDALAPRRRGRSGAARARPPQHRAPGRGAGCVRGSPLPAVVWPAVERSTAQLQRGRAGRLGNAQHHHLMHHGRLEQPARPGRTRASISGMYGRCACANASSQPAGSAALLSMIGECSPARLTAPILPRCGTSCARPRAGQRAGRSRCAPAALASPLSTLPLPAASAGPPESTPRAARPARVRARLRTREAQGRRHTRRRFTTGAAAYASGRHSAGFLQRTTCHPTPPFLGGPGATLIG